MYAILFTRDGRGGRFYTHEGTTVVATMPEEVKYLEEIIRFDGGQLVEFKDWPFDVIYVRQFADPWVMNDEYNIAQLRFAA